MQCRLTVTPGEILTIQVAKGGAGDLAASGGTSEGGKGGEFGEFSGSSGTDGANAPETTSKRGYQGALTRLDGQGVSANADGAGPVNGKGAVGSPHGGQRGGGGYPLGIYGSDGTGGAGAGRGGDGGVTTRGFGNSCSGQQVGQATAEYGGNGSVGSAGRTGDADAGIGELGGTGGAGGKGGRSAGDQGYGQGGDGGNGGQGGDGGDGGEHAGMGGADGHLGKPGQNGHAGHAGHDGAVVITTNPAPLSPFPFPHP